jgi:hypothetical protein
VGVPQVLVADGTWRHVDGVEASFIGQVPPVRANLRIAGVVVVCLGIGLDKGVVVLERSGAEPCLRAQTELGYRHHAPQSASHRFKVIGGPAPD